MKLKEYIHSVYRYLNQLMKFENKYMYIHVVYRHLNQLMTFEKKYIHVVYGHLNQVMKWLTQVQR